MLSRVADAVYWMGRYLERAENITRVLLVTDDFATETQGFAEDLAQAAWKDVLAILPSAELTRPVSAFAPLSLPYLQAFFVDGRNPYSVHYSLRKARENARAVREALTVEVFTSINETFRAVEAHGERRPDVTGLRDALASTHKGLFGIVGAIDSTLTRDETWHFFKLGETLERIYRTTLILRAKVPALTGGARSDQPLYYTQWRSLLRSVSSLENYRRARGAAMEGDLVIAFLLFDPHSPRSLRACSMCSCAIASRSSARCVRWSASCRSSCAFSRRCTSRFSRTRRPNTSAATRTITTIAMTIHTHVDIGSSDVSLCRMVRSRRSAR